MNQKTKLIIFGIGGLLLFLVAIFVVLVTRHEPVQEQDFGMVDDVIIEEVPLKDNEPHLLQNTKNIENFDTQVITPHCAFTNKDGTCVLSSDIQTDALEDITVSFLDISSITVTEEKRGVTTFSQELFSPIPLGQSDLVYFFLVDADNNSETGGSPATLNIPTTFKGAELVASILVSKHLVADPIVWKFTNGTFVKQKTNPDVRARIGAIELTADSFDGNTNGTFHTNDAVVLELPNEVRGVVSVPFRIQAISKQRNKIDSLKEHGVEIDWTPVTFPLCSVKPNPFVPGGMAVIHANGLVPSHDVVVDFETEQIATGKTDTKGNITAQFIVPANAQYGNNNIYVTSKGTALSASCGATVAGNDIPKNILAEVVDGKGRPIPGIYCRVFIQSQKTADSYFAISDENGHCGFVALPSEGKYRFATSNFRFSEPTYWFDLDVASVEGGKPPHQVVLVLGKSPEVVSCVDSDGGQNPGIKGFLTLTLDNGTKRIAEDECNSETDLYERWCTGGVSPPQEGIRREVCQNGCFDGACNTIPNYPLPTNPIPR